MKNFFIVNPNAGRKRKKEHLIRKIDDAKLITGQECYIYYTKSEKDGGAFVRKTCMENPEETFRFFGCGGDGTLNEIVNSAYGLDNAIVGSVPFGTGNDFARSFGNLKEFGNIVSQLEGKVQLIDIIKCIYDNNGQDEICYCDNMINIGFDSNVVEKAGEIRKKGVVTGSFAYLLGVAITLLKKKGANLKIELDNGYTYDGPLLLTAIANGKFCGGGVKSSPESSTNDGIIEVSIIKDISRLTFISLYPSYSKGTHLNKTIERDILIYNKVRKLKIVTNDEYMIISNDGEIIKSKSIVLEVLPSAIKFSVPKSE